MDSILLITVILTAVVLVVRTTRLRVSPLSVVSLHADLLGFRCMLATISLLSFSLCSTLRPSSSTRGQ